MIKLPNIPAFVKMLDLHKAVVANSYILMAKNFDLYIKKKEGGVMDQELFTKEVAKVITNLGKMACQVCGSNENGWCEALSRHADTDPMGNLIPEDALLEAAQEGDLAPVLEYLECNVFTVRFKP